MAAVINIESITPHVAEKIEVGAILVSSWGYEQTNVDYYVVVRTTDVSCWVLRMGSIEEPGQAYDTGYATPSEIITHYDQCECGHRVSDHDEHGCANFYPESEAWCYCTTPKAKPITPTRHKIIRCTSSESISLNSFSGAYLWDGKAKYASHYA